MKLVIGANGFLGSHVVRRLVADGEQVRVLTRATSNTRAIDEIPAGDGRIERVTGDLFDRASLVAAMRGVDDVFHCAVDTRAWLIDPAPLFRANVDGLRNVLDAAAGADLRSFVFASTIGTIGHHDRTVDETDEFNWGDVATDYIRSRVAAENVALRYAREGRVPVRAMCVANTYGPYDWKPTNHGVFVKGPALGGFPFRTRGMATESVAVDDAALAMTLAAARGRSGERYIVSERFLDLGELIETAAVAAGRRPPRPVLPRPVMYAIGAGGSALAKVTGTPQILNIDTVRLMHFMSPMSHAKAETELDWHPRPVLDAVAEGARFWVERRDRRRAERV
ncbi:NAD-dependent epimerase/dehydratase family protein [Gordonia pseudamarae]|jgi:dihydroflavonol-4-reductase|uniref:NAD-dependent epimerase/dehydratase family protein n=1 Tax=Gordonia pseudamarae TaxID=2831662 RepID=A0ABX6IL55_9ACTN|nr:MULTISPECIES: NAD-dependent epimerase/dehydratase family protein [Gordonia]MBD0021154.1 NAD-dependent epimerase/dehydratase family protein [Gordonia sp. (in: high G+C Gram-positive bacteria)]QHN27524.1 NAD-dependent epimerase/dehydratase family protein [Gordonia pseudamarae]QHN36406.1 NAD-dependent epimerase/dehydratase family protein [Gordonia pseudamarae]